jgi:hypothetical protein
MNATQTRGDEISRYLDRVRAALADLPAEVRDELLEDLPAHLAEVTSEDGGSLAERLGEPERYAAELRAAAGLTPGTTDGGVPALADLLTRLRRQARAADARLGPPLGYPRLSDFVRLLRPAWWLVRGYILFKIMTAAFTGDRSGVMPQLAGRLLLGVPVLVLFLVASVWLGRRSARAGRWPRRLLIAGNTLLAVLVLFAVARVGDLTWSSPGPSGYYDPYSGVTDIYPRGPDGRPISGVTLYDQNGSRIQIGNPWRCRTMDGSVGVVEPSYAYPLCAPGNAAQPGASTVPSGPEPSSFPSGGSAGPSVGPSAGPSVGPSVGPSSPAPTASRSGP